MTNPLILELQFNTGWGKRTKTQ